MKFLRVCMAYFEPVIDIGLRRSIREKFAEAQAIDPSLAIGTMLTSPLILYALVREIKPTNILETGVSSGCSTACMLLALNKNGKGRLTSIDFPIYRGEPIPYPEFGSYTPDGLDPGWIIPQHLKNRWRLVIGKSSDLLPSICQSLKSVDLFFHDSAHSYENVIFELDTVWEFIPKGGILVVDDITMNTAFHDFCTLHNHQPVIISNLGLLRKN